MSSQPAPRGTENASGFACCRTAVPWLSVRTSGAASRRPAGHLPDRVTTGHPVDAIIGGIQGTGAGGHHYGEHGATVDGLSAEDLGRLLRY